MIHYNYSKKVEKKYILLVSNSDIYLKYMIFEKKSVRNVRNKKSPYLQK